MPDTGATARRQQILDAAVACFGRYGYRRTSMEVIAQAARLSRPALYQYFSGKDEVFRAMGVRMLDGALTEAEAVRHHESPIADRLHAVLCLRLDLALGSGRHAGGAGRELLADAAAYAADLLASFQVRLIAIVEALLSTAGEFDLDASCLSAHDAAVVLLDAVAGIERDPAPPRTLRMRVRQLVDLVIHGLERR